MRFIGYILLGVAFGDAFVRQGADAFTVMALIGGGSCLWYGRMVARGGRPWF